VRHARAKDITAYSIPPDSTAGYKEKGEGTEEEGTAEGGREDHPHSEF